MKLKTNKAEIVRALIYACETIDLYTGECPFARLDADVWKNKGGCVHFCDTSIDSSICWEQYFILKANGY